MRTALKSRSGALALAFALACVLPAAAHAQGRTSQARRISVSWTEAPIRDVLRAFAAFSGASIVAGAGVEGFVTADINDQPWDVALESILATRGLVATENAYGIIRVENMADVNAREVVEALVTRSYAISFAQAAEIHAAVTPLLSARGSASVVPSANALVVTDVARVQRTIAELLR